MTYSAQQTLPWLRQAISRHMDERNILVGTATSAGAVDGTTLVSTLLAQSPDDTFRNGEVTMFAGTADNLGQARQVVSFTGGVPTTLAFPAQIQSGDGFEIRKHGPFADAINDSINEAILAVYNWAYVPKTDTSLDYVEDTDEYAIPAGFTLLYDVQYEASGDGEGDWTSLPHHGWYVLEDDTTPKIGLTTTGVAKLTDGQSLRLRGYRQPNTLSVETDVCEVNPNYVIAYAVGKLLGNFAGGQATDPDAHATRQRFWADVATVERRLAKTRTAPNVRRCRW